MKWQSSDSMYYVRLSHDASKLRHDGAVLEHHVRHGALWLLIEQHSTSSGRWTFPENHSLLEIQTSTCTRILACPIVVNIAIY